MTTYFERIIEDHIVSRNSDGTVTVAIDRILLHERTGSIALESLSSEGIPVCSPASVFGFIDHISATDPQCTSRSRMPDGEVFIDAMQEQCRNHGIRLWAPGQKEHGIVHVAGPELGIAFPGATLVCPDSHTTTLGALGAVAWGIGTSQCEKVLATGCFRTALPKTMLVQFIGRRPNRVSAKDIVLSFIAQHGSTSGLGYAVEFRNSDDDVLDMDARFTICNMAVEFGVSVAVFQPDEKTFAYLDGRAFSPERADMMRDMQGLVPTEKEAFDRVVKFDLSGSSPMISWGTNPECSGPVGSVIPQSAQDTFADALNYIALSAGQVLSGLAINGAFIGSCTNSRISDLRRAAAVLDGKRIASHVRGIVVPGSQAIKHQAEAEGLDRIFLSSGFEWHEPGCGMCFFAGTCEFSAEDRVISTTNRNFKGRQGPGVRTHIGSPETVAWSAVNGCISDIREFEH